MSVNYLWQHSYLALTWMRSSSWETFSCNLNWNAVVNTQETCMEPHTPFRNMLYCLCKLCTPIAVLCVDHMQVRSQSHPDYYSGQCQLGHDQYSTTLTHVVKLLSTCMYQAPSLCHLTRYIICIVIWVFRLYAVWYNYNKLKLLYNTHLCIKTCNIIS